MVLVHSHSLTPSSSLLSDETLLTNVACGVLSGVISSSIANPTDVLKVGFYIHKDCAGFCCCAQSKAAEQA